jgi:hypothetical protein
MARHFVAAVIPARARKPRDKAKAEAGVLLVERWILAALRKHKFFSLEELNRAISGLLEKLNNKPFKKLPGSRRSTFESLEKLALKPLPSASYEISQYKDAKVNINYHVALDDHYYSVPYQLVQKTIMIRYTINIVEILFNNKRVASHQRKQKKYAYTTLTEHMPPKHASGLKVKQPSGFSEIRNELNAAIAVLLTRLNEKKFQKIDGSRLSLFESIDRPALRALPVDDFTISE